MWVCAWNKTVLSEGQVSQIQFSAENYGGNLKLDCPKTHSTSYSVNEKWDRDFFPTTPDFEVKYTELCAAKQCGFSVILSKQNLSHQLSGFSLVEGKWVLPLTYGSFYAVKYGWWSQVIMVTGNTTQTKNKIRKLFTSHFTMSCNHYVLDPPVLAQQQCQLLYPTVLWKTWNKLNDILNPSFLTAETLYCISVDFNENRLGLSHAL